MIYWYMVIMMNQHNPYLPPNTYAPGPVPSGLSRFWQYSTYAASMDALESVKEHLKISPYRLGLLLGLDYPNMTYEWYKGRKRPSQSNCIRIIKLISMVSFEGLKLPLVQSINWESGEILYKGGVNDKSNHGVPPSKRTIPPSNSAYGVPMA